MLPTIKSSTNHLSLSNIFLVFPLFLITACLPIKSQTTIITGETMGTTYTIKYVSENTISKTAIDELLVQINQSVSTYMPESIISKINQAAPEHCKEIDIDIFFTENFELSKAIFEETDGYFNPALMPLVNYWGFGYGDKNRHTIDSNEVNRLLLLTNFYDFEYHQTHLTKKYKAQQVDFSAIAKGYGVDQIAAWLNAHHIDHYLIEIGGELRAKGKNAANEYWRIGIDQPQKNLSQRTLKAIVPIKNQSVATSGNYRNYRKLGTKEYGHIINPKTGFPEEKEIISATILAASCAVADAYATACMVMGFDKAKRLIENNTDLMAYFIYKNKQGLIATYQSDDLELIEID